MFPSLSESVLSSWMTGSPLWGVCGLCQLLAGRTGLELRLLSGGAVWPSSSGEGSGDIWLKVHSSTSTIGFFFFLVTPLAFSFVFVLLSTISFKKRRCLIPPPVWAVAGSYSFQYHPFWASVDWNDGGINDEWLRLPQMWFPLAPLSGIGDPLPQVEFLLREKIIENENLN